MINFRFSTFWSEFCILHNLAVLKENIFIITPEYNTIDILRRNGFGSDGQNYWSKLGIESVKIEVFPVQKVLSVTSGRFVEFQFESETKFPKIWAKKWKSSKPVKSMF